MNEIIKERLAAFRADQELPDLDEDKLFEAFAAFCVLHEFHEESFEPDLHRTGGGQDLGVDAWGIVINGDLYHDLDGVKLAVESNREMNVVVIAVQAKRSASAEGRVVPDLADNLRQICSRGPIAYTASPEVVELHEALGVLYDHQPLMTEHSPRLEVRYIHTGPEPNADLKEKCRSAEEALDELGRFRSIKVKAGGWRELDRLYRSTTRKVKAEFHWQNSIALPPMEGVKQAWTGTIPAAVIVERLLVDEGGSIRKFLFEDNLREFLGQSNKVNDEIAQTLADETKRKRFAVLNNGITVIARSFSVSGADCYMSDFQIVNGCQTGHVLFEHRDRLTEDVHVKLTVIEPQDEGIAEAITVATNRQTEISPEDLHGDQQIHRDIEEYFRIQGEPRNLYYERRSGQYDARTVTMTRVVKQNHLVQSYAAVFRGHVHEVSRAAKLRSDPSLRIFHRDNEPIAYYTAASIWYQIEWLLRNNRLDRKWKPARFMFMAAVVRRFSNGETLPASPRFAKRHCERLLERIWDRDEVERLVCLMVPHLQQLIESETSNQRLNDLARTKGFTERFLAAVAGVA